MYIHRYTLLEQSYILCIHYTAIVMLAYTIHSSLYLPVPTFIMQHVHLQACERKLLNVSGDLSSILSGMCQLMEVQQLAAKVHTGSDLHAILEQNVLDFCQWVCTVIIIYTHMHYVYVQ